MAQRSVREILRDDDPAELRALFSFDASNSDDAVLVKFNLWGRKLFPKYFKSPDAPFHKKINHGNLAIYRGRIDQFVDAAFRGAGKDMKTKLFVPFCIQNDLDHSRRYFKVLAEDGDNSRQSVTDIYNILVNPRSTRLYPETFEKTEAKREERMSSFTTSTGIKVTADTVGTEQRGANQEEARPDFIWFNDFETRKTLRSARETKSIWDNMEEARTGLEKGGGCVYTCNYISEMGNVHKLVTEKLSPRKLVLIQPIATKGPDGRWVPTWDRYTREDVEVMEKTDDDFEGERLCKPNAAKDVYFDREKLDAMPRRTPVDVVADCRIYRKYNPAHRYAFGVDVAGGVKLDSSAIVGIDFDTTPAQVVSVYASNEINPEALGDEATAQAKRYGNCLLAIENNKYDQAVLKAKLLGANLYMTGGKEIKAGHKPPSVYGWQTNSLSKPRMLSSLREAVESGLIELNDPAIIAELSAYTRNDLIDKDEDVRLTTRHFDLLVATAIAWQMKDHARPAAKPAKLGPVWAEKARANPAE